MIRPTHHEAIAAVVAGESSLAARERGISGRLQAQAQTSENRTFDVAVFLCICFSFGGTV